MWGQIDESHAGVRRTVWWDPESLPLDRDAACPPPTPARATVAYTAVAAPVLIWLARCVCTQNPASLAFRSEHGGRTYEFCSTDCKTTFDDQHA